MRSDSIEKVRNALGSRTLTIADLSKTGLSRNTIATALDWLGAEKLDTWPAQYRMPVVDKKKSAPSTVDVPSVTKAKSRVQVELVEHDDWALRWNMSRLTFGQSVSELVIDPHENPAELAKKFATAAKSLASAAHALDKVASMPDWYTLLGGNIEDEQVH